MSDTQTPNSPLSLLLCEDEPLIMIDLADVLRGHGHTVTEAATGSDGLKALAAREFDILIADISLPDISGVELARAARLQFPDIGIIFATAHMDIHETLQIELAIKVSKPYGEEDIVGAIERARPVKRPR